MAIKNELTTSVLVFFHIHCQLENAKMYSSSLCKAELLDTVLQKEAEVGTAHPNTEVNLLVGARYHLDRRCHSVYCNFTLKRKELLHHSISSGDWAA